MDNIEVDVRQVGCGPSTGSYTWRLLALSVLNLTAKVISYEEATNV
jgi:hypothetical protein